MIASVQIADRSQCDLVVGIAAKLQRLPRHDREFRNGNDAGVLNDEKFAPAGTHIRSDIAAFEQFLLANTFDEIFRCPAGIDKLERRLLDPGAHDSALHVPEQQCRLSYIGSDYCHTEIYLSDAGNFVARAQNVRRKRTTCSSDADLSVAITIHASAFNAPAKQMSASNKNKPISPGMIGSRWTAAVLSAVRSPSFRICNSGSRRVSSRMPSAHGALPSCGRGAHA